MAVKDVNTIIVYYNNYKIVSIEIIQMRNKNNIIENMK